MKLKYASNSVEIYYIHKEKIYNKNGGKQGDALSTVLFIYFTRQDNKKGIKHSNYRK